jgi:ATP-dependent Lon protease
LTDSSQNTDFHDKYFSELALDLSKCLVIFSYNNEEFINPILKDRMVTIKTSGYTNQNKVEIVEQYMLKELYNKFSFKDEDLVFPRDIISTIIRKTQEEKGVRNLKRSLEEILSQINLARLLNKGILSEDSKPITYPYTITQEDVEKLLKKTPVNDSLPMMYC